MAVVDKLGRRNVAGESRRGKPPPNKGKRYPPAPPRPDQILGAFDLLVVDEAHDLRLRAFMVLAWRAGLTAGEAIALNCGDVDRDRGLAVRRDGRIMRRAQMDPWGWGWIDEWLAIRRGRRQQPLLCVLRGPSKGERWSALSARAELRRLALRADVPRLTSSQLRYALVVELAERGVDLREISRQLGTGIERKRLLPAMQLTYGVDMREALQSPLESGPQGLVRRAEKAASEAAKNAKTPAARRAWKAARGALNDAEDWITAAIAEDSP